MKIQQYQIFKFVTQDSTYDFLANLYFQAPISHIVFFLKNYYGYVYRYKDPKKFISNIEKDGIQINDLDITIDKKNNLFYISELFFAPNYQDIMTEEEFYIKIEKMNILEIYQQNLFTSTILTKENFLQILIKWGQFLNIKYPFIILYLNDNNWYDLASFDTQDAMQQFIDKYVI